MSKAFPPARPHGEISEVFPDIFMVTGTMRFMPGFTIPRNMTIVRQGDELTLLNSVRLSPEGEAALERLGKVRHLVRLSSFHGLDDPYFRDRFKPTYWAPKGLDADRELSATESPVGQVTVFTHTKQPEAAVLLSGEVLQCCDSFQNWMDADLAACSWLGGVFMKRQGFRPELIGPFWLKAMGREVERDFRVLTELPFRHALSGHGTPIRDRAAEALRAEVARTFVGG